MDPFIGCLNLETLATKIFLSKAQQGWGEKNREEEACIINISICYTSLGTVFKN
jgi:hypothetical protein